MRISNLSPLFLAIIFFGIAFFDILTIFFPQFGGAGIIFWCLGFFCIPLYSFSSIKQVFSKLLTQKNFFTLFSLFFFLIFILYNSFQPSNLSGETTQEISCILDHLQNSLDKGFHQQCFLGYTARQYVIPALPSLIFERSQMALNLGGSIYFIVGLIIFLNGFFKEFLVTKKSDLTAAILIFSLLHFHYFNHFLFFSFEQSTFPMSFGLIVAGLLLQFKNTSKNSILLMLGISIYLVFSAYTPALALIPLIFFYLSLFLLEKKQRMNQKVLILIIMLLTVGSFFITFSFRNDIHILGNQSQQLQAVIYDTTLLFQHLFLKPEGVPYSSLLFSFLILGSMISPFILKQKKYYATPFWIIATFIIATISKGYAFYNLDFRVHRALVTAPFLLFLFGNLIIEIKIQYLKILLLIIALTGFSFSSNYLNMLEPQQHFRFIRWLQSTDLPKNEAKIHLIGDAQNDFISLNDELTYFFPNLSTEAYLENTHLDNICAEDLEGYILISENHRCFETYTQTFVLARNEAYRDSSKNNLFLFFQNKEN